MGAELASANLKGSYSPYVFLSSDVGVAHGREIHGQPKKLGEPRLEHRDDLVVGTVVHNGIEVVMGTMAYKQRRDSLERLTRHFDFAENINLKVVDHIDGSPAIRQLTARRLADVAMHECWGGPCTVEIGRMCKPRFTACRWSKCWTGCTGARTSVCRSKRRERWG